VEEAAARAEAPKKLLILMSDTGGGHRASAEAIKAAFSLATTTRCGFVPILCAI
jgi:predicted Ser/Thr protein kinase